MFADMRRHYSTHYQWAWPDEESQQKGMGLFKKTRDVRKARSIIRENYSLKELSGQIWNQKIRRKTIPRPEQSSYSESASEECEGVESVIKELY